MTDAPARSERASEAIARHIESLILEGSLRPGDSLLSEREMAEKLGVSRPTIRDGLKLLERRGLLRSEHGRGTWVAELGHASIADPLLALLARNAEVADDYLEFRDFVESSAAAVAAVRATELDLERLQECLNRIDAAHEKCDPEEEAQADAALHLAIYEASHNLVLLQIMRALSGNLQSNVVQNRMFATSAIRETLRAQHHSIANAIIARDGDKARNAAHDHLTYIKNVARKLARDEEKLNLSARRITGSGLRQKSP
ncbi:MAG: FCD domain-containing protein [Paracoccus sp. (in: a-proteobacteria)]|nr:FCD domain-containing protein [Paracoccus sp. (in: a-proteobacteria)]